jgi:hypothetical protein
MVFDLVVTLFFEGAIAWLPLLLALAAWLGFGCRFLHWHRRRYVLEEGRVHVLDGLLTLQHRSVQYSFSSLDLRQGFWGRLLNYGSLTVGTPPNVLHIARLNNFSLAKVMLCGTSHRPFIPQVPAAQPPVVVQPPPVAIVLTPDPTSRRWLERVLRHLRGDGVDGWYDHDFSATDIHPDGPPGDTKPAAPDKPWYESEAEEEETAFHASHTSTRSNLRTVPSIFQDLGPALRQGMKWSLTPLLDYLDALGEGVILAAQWIYQLCLQLIQRGDPRPP